MAVRIIEGTCNSGSSAAVLYCSTSMTAFGPVFESAEVAEAFLAWFRERHVMDVRSIDGTTLEERYHTFLTERGEL